MQRIILSTVYVNFKEGGHLMLRPLSLSFSNFKYHQQTSNMLKAFTVNDHKTPLGTVD